MSLSVLRSEQYLDPSPEHPRRVAAVDGPVTWRTGDESGTIEPGSFRVFDRGTYIFSERATIHIEGVPR